MNLKHLDHVETKNATDTISVRCMTTKLINICKHLPKVIIQFVVF